MHFGIKNRLSFLIDFGLPFGGLILDPGDFRGTSPGLRRDFKGRVSPAQPPQGGALNKKRDHITASGSQTRDPTRPGPEARRIFGFPDMF